MWAPELQAPSAIAPGLSTLVGSESLPTGLLVDILNLELLNWHDLTDHSEFLDCLIQAGFYLLSRT